MKKVHIRALGALLGCFITIFSLRISASAVAIVDSGYYGGEGDGANISWTLDADGVLTVSGTGNMKGSTYPEPENDWSGWDHLRDSIRQVVITEGVATIGNEAFRDCPNLTGVSFPNSIMWIRDSAFARCNALTTITIPKSVKSLGHFAFSDCSSLKSISFEEGFQSYGMGAFDGCASLMSLTFPKTVTDIYDLTFDNCKSLKSIYFCGKAPYVWESASPSSASYTIYYISGMTGWTDSSAYDAVKETWHGKPLKTWTGDSDSGKIKLVSSSPLNGQVGFKKNDPLILTFSQDISQNPDWTKGSIYIKSYYTDATIAEIDESKFNEIDGTILGNQMIIPEALNFPVEKYYILIDPDVIVAVNPTEGVFPGISDKDTLSFEAKLYGSDFKMGRDSLRFNNHLVKYAEYIREWEWTELVSKAGNDTISVYQLLIAKHFEGGVCFGMAAFMQQLYKGVVDSTQFGARTPSEMAMTDQVKSMVAYYHLAQKLPQFRGADKADRNKGQDDLAKEIISSLMIDPMPIIVNLKEAEITSFLPANLSNGDHTVLAYAVDAFSDESNYIVYIADSNAMRTSWQDTGGDVMAYTCYPTIMLVDKATYSIVSYTNYPVDMKTTAPSPYPQKVWLDSVYSGEDATLLDLLNPYGGKKPATQNLPFTVLDTTASSFSITANGRSAVVTNGAVTGDLELYSGNSTCGLNMYYIEDADNYTITFSDTSEKRTTILYCNNSADRFCGEVTSDATSFQFRSDGQVSISGATSLSTVGTLLNMDSGHLAAVKVTSENADLILRAENEKCNIASTSKLGAVTVEGINQNTSATVNAVISGSSADVYEGSIAHSNDLILEEDGEVLAFSDLPGKLGGSVGWNYVSEAGQIRFSGEMPKGGYVFAAFYADSRKLIEVRVVNSTDDILTVPSDCKTLDMFLLGEDMRPLCVNQTVIVQISNGAIPFDPVNKRLE